LPTTGNAEGGHDRGNDNIWPAGARPKHVGGGKYHGDIAKYIIAGAYPSRPHIRIADPETIKQECNSSIGEEPNHPDDARELGVGKGTVVSVERGRSHHPKSKCEKGNAFEKGSAGAPGERHTADTKADGVVCRIAKKVERVRLERAGTGRETGAHLGKEHRCVGDKRNPERACPCQTVESNRRTAIMIAATGHWKNLSYQRATASYAPCSRYRTKAMAPHLPRNGWSAQNQPITFLMGHSVLSPPGDVIRRRQVAGAYFQQGHLLSQIERATGTAYLTKQFSDYWAGIFQPDGKLACVIGEMALLATVAIGVGAELPAEVPVANEAELTLALGTSVHGSRRRRCTSS
jgi:hypothetical protein